MCEINHSSTIILRPSTTAKHYTNIHTPCLFFWLQLNGTVGLSGSRTEKCNQMFILVVVFLWSTHRAVEWMPAEQTGRQCVVTSSTLQGEGSVLPEPNGEPDFKKQSSVEHRDEWFSEQTIVVSFRDKWSRAPTVVIALYFTQD